MISVFWIYAISAKKNKTTKVLFPSKNNLQKTSKLPLAPKVHRIASQVSAVLPGPYTELPLISFFALLQ
jgi:hypothetical protein